LSSDRTILCCETGKPKNRDPASNRHSREGGNPVKCRQTSAVAGMTALGRVPLFA
jgi:hypothetical protein